MTDERRTMTSFWKRLPRIRRPQVADVIRVNGKLHMVVSIEWPGERVELQALGDVLARSLAVSDEREPKMLADALAEAGWLDPDQAQRVRERIAELEDELGITPIETFPAWGRDK